MPQIKSAIKRVKVTKVKNLNNRINKTAMRNIVKKFENGVAENKADAGYAERNRQRDRQSGYQGRHS